MRLTDVDKIVNFHIKDTEGREWVLLPIKTLAELPIVDAVPVVRCKDCVHYKPKDAMTPGKNRMRCNHPCLDYDIECYDLWLDVEPNDYCKYGEKKMDGGAE